jgi:hypothetical protein
LWKRAQFSCSRLFYLSFANCWDSDDQIFTLYKLLTNIALERLFFILSIEYYLSQWCLILLKLSVDSHLHVLGEGHKVTDDVSDVEVAHSSSAGYCDEQYCSEQCRKDSWKLYHEFQCRNGWLLRKLNKFCQQGTSSGSRVLCLLVRFVGTALQRQKYSLLDLDITALTPSYAVQSSLVFSKEFFNYSLLCEVMRLDSFSQPVFDFSTYLYLYDVINNNSFAIFTERERVCDLNASGAALYLGASLFNHQCGELASIEYSFERGNVFRASVAAPFGVKKGSELFINYFPFSPSLDGRRDCMRQYGFICVCDLCTLQAEGFDIV